MTVENLDPSDRTVVAAAAAAGAHALWRAERRYLVQGQPVTVDARVVSFAAVDDLSPADRVALAFGELLWTAAPAPMIRFATLFDGHPSPGAAGVAGVTEARRLDGPDRVRVLAYLAGAPHLLATTAQAADLVDPGGSAPGGLRTDGVWVWPEATRYYLDKHRLAPDPGLLAHIAAAGYAVPKVGPAALHRALAAAQARR